MRPPPTAAFLLLAALAVPSPSLSPLAAQDAPLRPGCTREVVQPPEPSRPSKPKRPEEARRDSIELDVLARLRELINQHAVASGIDAPKGALVFQVAADRSGAELAGFRTNLPDSLVARIEAEAAALLVDWPVGADAYIHMRIDRPRIPDLPVGTTTIHCPPELLHRELVTRAVAGFARENPAIGRLRPQRAVVRFYLTREGTVLAPSIERSSGSAKLDAFAVDLVSRLGFRPARFRDAPVDVWNRIPITIEQPRPAL